MGRSLGTRLMQLRPSVAAGEEAAARAGLPQALRGPRAMEKIFSPRRGRSGDATAGREEAAAAAVVVVAEGTTETDLTALSAFAFLASSVRAHRAFLVLAIYLLRRRCSDAPPPRRALSVSGKHNDDTWSRTTARTGRPASREDFSARPLLCHRATAAE